ncbi:MAG: iron-containing alcohol dehydrogenase [Chloroflexi bacterium]|nr:MAG: iron-containing alcohol dehydrogenase [Chloroflexota bacterium]
MRFEFATANRVVFGAGTVKEAAPAARAFGERALVVIGDSVERAEGLLAQLRAAGLAVSVFQVFDEPKVETALAGVTQARAQNCNLVIALGGGSVLDTGKAIAALLTNPGEPYDYLEVVGRGQALVNPSAPMIAIPTTAGTGSEVTRNAVLAATQQKVKVSLRSPWMLPRLAIVDPELTYSLPPAVTASTGLDALTQVIEPFLSNAANPMTDALCREGMRRAARSLRQACEHGDDALAREDMSLVSLFGGMALANAKLGAVHGFAGPIGGMFPAPHGAVCARLLPIVLEVNWRAIQERMPQSIILQRFDEVAQILTGKGQARADEGIAWLKELAAALKIPPLAEYGVTTADFPVIAAQAQKASSMKGNPLELTESELLKILGMAG